MLDCMHVHQPDRRRRAARGVEPFHVGVVALELRSDEPTSPLVTLGNVFPPCGGELCSFGHLLTLVEHIKCLHHAELFLFSSQDCFDGVLINSFSCFELVVIFQRRVARNCSGVGGRQFADLLALSSLFVFVWERVA